MLFVIPTPIGNLGDTTIRSLEVLEKVEILLCEDTRVTAKLLDLLGIKNKPKLISYYQEVEGKKLTEVLGYLQKSCKVGLVCDAGTPLLSDPGWILLKTCRKLNIEIEVLPGASSILTALLLSGLPCDKFIFLGFLPKKMVEKEKFLTNYPELTKVAFESPERLVETVGLMPNEATISVCREITKIHQEVISGKRDLVLEKLDNTNSRGEVVIVWTQKR